MWKRQRIFILILSIWSNGDQINDLLLILLLIPISTPPSIDHNSALGNRGWIGKNFNVNWKKANLVLTMFSLHFIYLKRKIILYNFTTHINFYGFYKYFCRNYLIFFSTDRSQDFLAIKLWQRNVIYNDADSEKRI